MVRIIASRPNCPLFDSERSRNFQRKNIADVTEVYQRHCLEERRQWLENVDQTRLVLASGLLVLVLQKSLVTLHDAVDDLPRMALHLPQHQEVGHDGVGEEGQHDEDQEEQKNISGRDLQFFMSVLFYC